METMGGAFQAQLLATVQDFSGPAVTPHGERIGAHPDGAREALRDTMCRDGVGALLAGLGPGIRWRAPVPEIEGMGSGELRTDGRGLVLTRSLFLRRAAHVGPTPV
ncbi:hypothetical protein [Streptomyces europaeiscabiei]|uniref:hypothetical protein n=2 Tax=Streptomyces europaeiscabiei TaxID=146819 RepID=UPI002E17F211